MGDETEETTVTVAETTTTEEPKTQTATSTPTDAPPEMKAALRKANKEAEALRLRLKQYEDANKSELEKLEERASLAERQAAEHASELLRLRVGVSKSLPADLVGRLRGDTEEELSADADALLALLNQPKAKGAVDQGSRTPPAQHALNGDPLQRDLERKLGITS